MPPFLVGAVTFSSKTAAAKAFRQIANEAELGQPLSDPHKTLLVALIQNHHRAPDRKLGGGVQDILVRTNSYRKRAFYIKHTNGFVEDFSWVQCVYPPKPSTRLKQALRHVVLPQIQAALDKAFGVDGDAHCEVSGKAITRDTCDVHHASPQFDELVTTFLEAEGLDPANVEYLAKPTVEGPRLNATWVPLGLNFAEFHRTHAKLVVVDKMIHRKLSKKPKKPKPQTATTVVDMRYR